MLAPLLRELWSELDTEHSFSIWYGWAPTRDLPDMAFSVEGNVYLATYAIYADPADDERYRDWVHAPDGRPRRGRGDGVYLGDTDFTRRHGPLPERREPAPARGSAPPATRGACSPPTYVADPARLNVHD